ncbi:MAG: hypothetical protein NT120_03470 [Candidatus Aenigmarchaeota archaeon]|nr:hypothetical protein [Candidatus Aenigmarchaeota archaeon]
MKHSYNIKHILNSNIAKNLARNLFGNSKTEVIERPASFIIKLKNEPENKINRIILLPPHGFTANKINETVPHPEVRKAKVEIKGGIRPDKSGFNPIKNCIKYQYYTIRNVNATKGNLYIKIGEKHYKEDVKSSRQKFFVVRENDIGFYHSLVNLTEEWVLLILYKELRLQKIPGLKQKLEKLDRNQQRTIYKLYEKISLLGDAIFEKENKLIDEICEFDADKITPSLIEMLNILETGKHEPCTVFAIILKLGRKTPKVINYLKEAVKGRTAPRYYLDELISKL